MLNPDHPKFITTCEETEDGNLAITFPDELLEAMGWHEGTMLDIYAIAGQISIRECTDVASGET